VESKRIKKVGWRDCRSRGCNVPMKSHHPVLLALYILWFLAIPLLGPDGTFPMCMKDNRPVECEKWKVLGKFEKYDDCFNAQMETRGHALRASHDIASAAHEVQDLRAACLREGDPRLTAR
jgi:hypothetical protein